ncbi:MAG: hypothetical protein ACYDAQ_16310 [Mycobacteriales bacterium]
MARSTSKGARLTALALATGTLVVAAASGAGAATNVQQFSAQAGGSALNLSVYLPVDVAGLTVNHHFDLSISLTNGVATLNGVTKVANTSATLASTTSSILGALVDKNTSASLSSPSESTSILGPETLPAGLGSVALGPVSSSVGSLTNSALVARSSSALDAITLVPTGLPAISSVTSTLTSTLNQALGTASSTANGAAGTLTNAINGAVNQLNTASQGATAPVVTAVKSVESTLTGALTSVEATLSSLTAAPALLSMTNVVQNHSITRSGDAITSSASAALGNLNILGGLVSLSGLDSAVTATAGGVPGSAHVTFPAQPVVKLSVANNALTFLIDSTGLHLQGALSAVPASLQSAVNGALGNLTSLLNQVAGVSVTYGKGTSQAAANGTFAAGQISSTAVTITPAVLKPLLPAGAPYFLQVSLVPVHASVANRLVPASVANPTIVPNIPTHTLAYTGADLPISAGIATGLAGLALVIRRRRRMALPID